MKKYISKFILLFIVLLTCSVAVDAQFVVKVRPGVPVVRVRPAMPSARHVWVSGEYAWRGANIYILMAIGHRHRIPVTAG